MSGCWGQENVMRNCWHGSASIDRSISTRSRTTCSRRLGSISAAKRRRKSRLQLFPRWRRCYPIGRAVSCVNAGVTLTQSQPPSAKKRRSDLMSVGAVVLAAGGSARFRKPKQFALFRGETFIRRIVAGAIEARCAPVVVVTGKDSARIGLELSGLTVSIALNPHWQSGLGSSIVVGIRHAMNLAPDIDAALLLTCDQPFVTAAVLTQLIQLRLTSRKPIIASAYAGTFGIPALFDRSCFPDLLRLKGDHGAKGIIFERRYDVASFNFPAAAIDIDMVGDYEKLDQNFTCTPGHSPAED